MTVSQTFKHLLIRNANIKSRNGLLLLLIRTKFFKHHRSSGADFYGKSGQGAAMQYRWMWKFGNTFHFSRESITHRYEHWLCSKSLPVQEPLQRVQEALPQRPPNRKMALLDIT